MLLVESALCHSLVKTVFFYLGLCVITDANDSFLVNFNHRSLSKVEK